MDGGDILGGIGLGGVGVAIGAGGKWLADYIRERRAYLLQSKDKETAQQKQEREDDDAAQKRHHEAIIAGYEDLLKKVKFDLKRVEDRQDILFREHTLCEKMRARAEERISALEDALRRAGIEFRQWNPDGSGLHAPLPSDSGGADRRVVDDPNYAGPERRRPEEKGT